MNTQRNAGQSASGEKAKLREYADELATFYNPDKWNTEATKRSTNEHRKQLYDEAEASLNYRNFDLANLQLKIDIIRSLNAISNHAQYRDPKIPKGAPDKEQQESAHKLAGLARTQMKEIASSGEALARQLLTDSSPGAKEERVALKNILGAYDQLGILCRAESYKDPALVTKIQKPFDIIQTNLGPMQNKDRWKEFASNKILWTGVIISAVGLALTCSGFGAAIGGPLFALGLAITFGEAVRLGDKITPKDLADDNKQTMKDATSKMTSSVLPEGANPNTEIRANQDRGQVYTRPTNLSRSTTVTPSSQEQQIQTEADNSQKQSRHFRK